MPEHLETMTTLLNKAGLHARAAGKLASLANQFEADVSVNYEGKSARADSILDLLMLTAPKGATITLKITGKDAEDARTALLDLITDKFGERG